MKDKSSKSAANDGEAIKQHAESVIAAGAIGRSEAAIRLLRYLAERAHTKKSLKEIEIAVDVFNRDASFDPSQDSLIRVNIHKLRAKLEQFYEREGIDFSERLKIPKNSYVLTLEKNSNTSPAARHRQKKNRKALALSLAFGLIVGLLFAFILENMQPISGSNGAAIQSDIWSPLVSEDRPLTVVLGEIFIFSEVSGNFEQLREIRDFSINSAEDFSQRMSADSVFGATHRDFGIRYLPRAIGHASARLGNFLGEDSLWEVQFSSEVDLDALLDSGANVIYIGYYTGLIHLKDIAFNQSSMQLHPNGNLLFQSETGDVFVGEGTLSPEYRDRYTDFSLMRKVQLESGGTLFALMSARDTGLANLIDYAFSVDGTVAIESFLDDKSVPFEMLLETSGAETGDMSNQIRLVNQQPN